jgi:WhiB family transcriptional regulator, redox-sensing transcriptional regulator
MTRALPRRRPFDLGWSGDTPDWRARGVCTQADPEAWFPGQGDPVQPAKRICDRCEVKDPCLAWALEHHEDGVWGGTTARERERMRAAT